MRIGGENADNAPLANQKVATGQPGEVKERIGDGGAEEDAKEAHALHKMKHETLEGGGGRWVCCCADIVTVEEHTTRPWRGPCTSY